jgi:hypothetical protein
MKDVGERSGTFSTQPDWESLKRYKYAPLSSSAPPEALPALTLKHLCLSLKLFCYTLDSSNMSRFFYEPFVTFSDLDTLFDRAFEQHSSRAPAVQHQGQNDNSSLTRSFKPRLAFFTFLYNVFEPVC